MSGNVSGCGKYFQREMKLKTTKRLRAYNTQVVSSDNLIPTGVQDNIIFVRCCRNVWCQQHEQGPCLSPVIKGCTLVIGMVGLGAAGTWGSSGLAGSSSGCWLALKLPRGLTFTVVGVSTSGRSSSVTETTSILEGSGCSGASAPASGP